MVHLEIIKESDNQAEFICSLNCSVHPSTIIEWKLQKGSSFFRDPNIIEVARFSYNFTHLLAKNITREFQQRLEYKLTVFENKPKLNIRIYSLNMEDMTLYECKIINIEETPVKYGNLEDLALIKNGKTK